MNAPAKTLSLLFVLGLAACDSSSSPDEGDGAGPGGKADETESVECAPDAELRLELVGRDANESSDGDQLTNSVRAACFNDEGFEDSACCAEVGMFDAYREATSCPEHVVLNAPQGNASMQRCADAATGEFVASACCSDICDPEARTNSAGRCIDGAGQFEDSLCCFLNNALDTETYAQPEWDRVRIDGIERLVCRDQATGRFAMNSACVAECVQAIGEEGLRLDSNLTGWDVPAACQFAITVEAPQSECPDLATENSAGICHNPDNGQFAKAACCQAKGGEALACHWDTEPVFGVIEGYEDEDGGYVDPSQNLLEQIADYDYESVDASTEIDSLLRAQIEASMLHLGFILPGMEDHDASLFDVDGDTVYVINGALDDQALTWIRFYAGDTEVGVIFERDSVRPLAEIGDGDIMGCR